MSRTDAVGALALAAALALGARPASAQIEAAEPSEEACLQDADCRGHYESARRLSKAGQSEGALTEYQAAYLRRPAPRLLYNIARLQQKLGQPAAALASYRRFLATSSSPADEELRARAREYRAQLEREVEPPPPPPPGPTAGPSAPAPPPPPPPAHEPVYKKWWVWTLVGVAAAGVVTGLVLANRSGEPTVPAGAQTYAPTFPASYGSVSF